MLVVVSDNVIYLEDRKPKTELYCIIQNLRKINLMLEEDNESE